MDAPKVTVVVPVYNPGEGVERCIGSLRGQTLADIEIIFIDDHGSDGAMDVVERHSGADGRIRVLRNPENLGAGPSRNAGIEAARGEYLSFVDPDDYVEPDFLERLHAAAEAAGADIAKGMLANTYEKAGTEPPSNVSTVLNDTIRKLLVKGKPIYSTFSSEHTTALYRRAMLMESGARYGTSRNGQDTTFLLRACHAARSIAFDDDAVYHYVRRDGSAVRTLGQDRLRNELKALEEKLDYVSENLSTEEPAYQLMAHHLRWSLRIHNHVLISEISDETADCFLSSVRGIAERLPSRMLLARQGVDMCALVDHGINLCLAVDSSATEEEKITCSLAALSRWETFMKDHPSEDGSSLKEYRRQIRSFLKYHPDSLSNPDTVARIQGAIEIASFDFNQDCVQGTPKVTVVVPVYNPGEGVERCIGSLRGQTLADIEIIFIDDHGSDGAMDVVERHAGADGRIRVLRNPENLGAGPSRNAGIEAARGEYLSFVDPDDYVEPDFLERLHAAAEAAGADIAKGIRTNVGEQGVVIPEPGLATAQNEHIRKGLLRGEPLFDLFTYQHTTALYRRAMLMESGARYGTSRNGEDTTFLLRACHASRSIAFDDRAVYRYVRRDGSAVRTLCQDRMRNELRALEEKLDYVSGLPADRFTVGYAGKRIRNVLAVHALAVSLGVAPEAANAFLGEVRALALATPLAERLKAWSIDIWALVDYGENLCPFSSVAGFGTTSLEASLQIAGRWADFARRHATRPPGFEARLTAAFANALAVHAAEHAADAGDGRGERCLSELRERALSLPDGDLLLDRSPEMGVLLSDGVNLCQAPPGPGLASRAAAHLGLVSSWAGFVGGLDEVPAAHLRGMRDAVRQALRTQLELEGDNPAAARGYLADLREAVLAAPCSDTLARWYVDVGALVDHGANLCAPAPQGDPRKRVEANAEAVERWASFVEADASRLARYGEGLQNRIAILRASQKALLGE